MSQKGAWEASEDNIWVGQKNFNSHFGLDFSVFSKRQ